MGIRYYAYPLPAEFVERAKIDPHLFMSADPLADAWGPAEDRPTMLYLDKCWSLLQRLTRPDLDSSPRPAYRLFEGDVTFVHDGLAWIPWIRALDPGEVVEVAQDLCLLDSNDIRALFQRPDFRGRKDDFDYLAQYLAEAQSFATRMSKAGSGLLYLIG